jgi:hypothetical protein
MFLELEFPPFAETFVFDEFKETETEEDDEVPNHQGLPDISESVIGRSPTLRFAFLGMGHHCTLSASGFSLPLRC